MIEDNVRTGSEENPQNLTDSVVTQKIDDQGKNQKTDDLGQSQNQIPDVNKMASFQPSPHDHQAIIHEEKNEDSEFKTGDSEKLRTEDSKQKTNDSQKFKIDDPNYTTGDSGKYRTERGRMKTLGLEKLDNAAIDIDGTQSLVSNNRASTSVEVEVDGKSKNFVNLKPKKRHVLENKADIINQKFLFTQKTVQPSISFFPDSDEIIVKKAIDYFDKPAKERLDHELLEFTEMISKVPFFQQQYTGLVSQSREDQIEYPSDTEFYTSTLKLLLKEKLRAGEPLFHEGDQGNKLYYVLDGGVMIFVKRTHDAIKKDIITFENIKNTMRSQEANGQLSKVSSKIKNIYITKERDQRHFCDKPSNKKYLPIDAYEKQKDCYDNNIDFKFIIQNDNLFGQLDLEDFYMLMNKKWSKYFKDGAFLYHRVTTIFLGRCFGELALVNDNKRAATAIPKRDAIVLTLNKKDYKVVFAVSLALENEKNIFFTEMFPTLDKAMLIKFMYLWKEKRLKRGNILFKEGDKFEYIYLIKRGTVSLLKKKDNSLTEKNIKDVKDNNLNLEKFDMEKNMLWMDSLVHLGSVADYNFVGETDVLEHRKSRWYTCMAETSQTVVYYITISNFLESESYLRNFFIELRTLASVKKNFRNSLYNEHKNLNEINEILCKDIKKIDVKPNDINTANHKQNQQNVAYRDQLGSDVISQYHPIIMDVISDQMKESENQKMIGPENLEYRDYSFNEDRVRRNRIFLNQCIGEKKGKSKDYLDSVKNPVSVMEKFKKKFIHYKQKKDLNAKLTLDQLRMAKEKNTRGFYDWDDKICKTTDDRYNDDNNIMVMEGNTDKIKHRIFLTERDPVDAISSNTQKKTSRDMKDLRLRHNSLSLPKHLNNNTTPLVHFNINNGLEFPVKVASVRNQINSSTKKNSEKNKIDQQKMLKFKFKGYTPEVKNRVLSTTHNSNEKFWPGENSFNEKMNNTVHDLPNLGSDIAYDKIDINNSLSAHQKIQRQDFVNTIGHAGFRVGPNSLYNKPGQALNKCQLKKEFENIIDKERPHLPPNRKCNNSVIEKKQSEQQYRGQRQCSPRLQLITKDCALSSDRFNNEQDIKKQFGQNTLLKTPNKNTHNLDKTNHAALNNSNDGTGYSGASLIKSNKIERREALQALKSKILFHALGACTLGGSVLDNDRLNLTSIRNKKGFSDGNNIVNFDKTSEEKDQQKKQNDSLIENVEKLDQYQTMTLNRSAYLQQNIIKKEYNNFGKKVRGRKERRIEGEKHKARVSIVSKRLADQLEQVADNPQPEPENLADYLEKHVASKKEKTGSILKKSKHPEILEDINKTCIKSIESTNKSENETEGPSEFEVRVEKNGFNGQPATKVKDLKQATKNSKENIMGVIGIDGYTSWGTD